MPAEHRLATDARFSSQKCIEIAIGEVCNRAAFGPQPETLRSRWWYQPSSAM